MKPSPFVLGLFIGISVCLVIARACEAPPAGPSRDSLKLVRAERRAAAAEAKLDLIDTNFRTAVDSAVADTLRFLVQRGPRPVDPPEPDTMDLAGQRAAARYWHDRARKAEALNDTAAAMLTGGAVRLTRLRDSTLHITAALRDTLARVRADILEGAVAIGKLTADVRKARAADRIRLGVGADLSVVPGVATLVVGGQITTRRRLWIAELEASAVAGVGVAATQAEVKTGPGGALQFRLTF